MLRARRRAQALHTAAGSGLGGERVLDRATMGGRRAAGSPWGDACGWACTRSARRAGEGAPPAQQRIRCVSCHEAKLAAELISTRGADLGGIELVVTAVAVVIVADCEVKVVIVTQFILRIHNGIFRPRRGPEEDDLVEHSPANE